MKRYIISCLIVLFISIFVTGISFSHANEGKPEHLLDGVSMNYYYQTGWGIHINFYQGVAAYEWIAGPRKGAGAKDIPYKSRKIGPEMYLVNWHEKDKHDFVTLIFNFEQNVMYGSAIVKYGSGKEIIVFSGGIIEHLKR